MNFNSLWVEKYRPKTLEQLCLSKKLRELIESWKEIPHLLLIGTPGTGKTTLARILVTEILKCDYLYINASDENGIDTIRTKVTGFVQTKSLDGNIKVVILDEADGLTLDGQNCLRNLMETYALTSRFILTGNSRFKIKDAIQSRCQSLELFPTLEDSVKRCEYILRSEKIDFKNDVRGIANLIKRFHPDLRKIINELQKRCTNGVFSEEVVKTKEISEFIWKNVLVKKGLLTRKYLIENSVLFDSDWDQLLKNLLNYVYGLDIDEENKKSAILTIADFLESSTRVVDKEINACACYLKLETLFS